MTAPDPRVDELRQRLRSLGYLDAGVDRFLLGAARETRGPFALAARASLRVGLLGGVLLGPAAAIGVGARLPGLISGVRDALVIAVYLALLFGLAATIISFVMSAMNIAVFRARTFPPDRAFMDERAAAAGRRAAHEISEWRSILLRWLSQTAGLLLTFLTLGYLTLWWRNANAGFGWSAPVWTSFALLVAVAISLLLGHAQRITTVAVLAAAAGPGASLPAVTNRSWRGILAGGALAFAGAAALLVVTTSAESAPAVAEPLTVVSRGITVKVIAVDGVDPSLVDEREWAPLEATGYRYKLALGDTGDPARTWTTIATGEQPEVHGIHGIEGRRVAGIRGMLSPETSATGRVLQQATDLIRLTRTSLASRNERKVMTFWEVAEAAGLRSTVVNWWATWPAVSRNGIVVSDRAVLRLERGGTLDAEISPPAAYDDLLKRWPRISKDAETLAQRNFASVADRDAAAILMRSAMLDASVLAMDDALAQPHLDLDIVYLPGLDIAQHALLGDQGTAAIAPSVLSVRLAALRAYHHFLGELIRPSVRPVRGQATIIITAPGRIGSSSSGHLTMFQWIDRPPPMEMPRDIELKDVARFDEVADRTTEAVDIAPTILNLLGIPISRELPGSVLSAFAPKPERYVATYGRPSIDHAKRTGQPLDQETIDRLRSLGYIR